MSTDDLRTIKKRLGNCTAQTRCDKCTLATLYLFHKDGRGHVSSMSELIRLTLEFVENYVETNNPDFYIMSSEDADDILSEAFKANLNPKGKYMTTFMKQLQREDAYLEGRPVGEIDKPRVTKAITKKSASAFADEITPEAVMPIAKDLTAKEERDAGREFRTPDNVETPEEAAQRRAGEEQELDGLATVPADTIAEEESDDSNN